MMSTTKAAWKNAAWVFILSRLTIIMLTFLGVSLFPANGTLRTINCFTNARACVITWMHFDVFSYIDIALHGYTNIKATAFFPLFPALLRFPGAWLGGSLVDYYVAGIIISNIFFFFALVFLYLLVDDLFDASTARTSLFYLAFAPCALFFFIGYTEALFVLFCIISFFCLQKAVNTQKVIFWLLAGISGFFAALSRSQGVLLAVPFLMVFLQQYFFARKFSKTTWGEKILALGPIVLIPLGVGVYMLYLWHTKGDPLLFSKSEALSWGRSLTPPWISVGNAVYALFKPNNLQIQNLLNLASLVVVLTALIIGWKRLPLHYTVFATLLVIFPLLYPLGTADGLTALPRYMLIIFPATIIFASYKGPRFEKSYLALTLPLFAINALLFLSHYWVA